MRTAKKARSSSLHGTQFIYNCLWFHSSGWTSDYHMWPYNVVCHFYMHGSLILRTNRYYCKLRQFEWVA